MFANALLAIAFQVLPFYEQKPESDYYALRPIVATEKGETDFLWPLLTVHRDWWRFCLLAHYQNDAAPSDGYQFMLAPIWFNGRDRETSSSYAGLFPVAGYHPHIAMLYDFKFALWPLWHQYKMPRGREWMKTNSILFPFINWRSDGAWSVWPFYGINYQRESEHQYILWPFITWATYREDRDTAGEGASMMIFPLYAGINRDREKQISFFPPFFSFAKTAQSRRVRAPWPFVEFETSPSRERLSVWPFYESVQQFTYRDKEKSSRVKRFGWKLVELYDDETRVFPFYASGRDHSRIWPFWEAETEKEVTHNRFLSLLPIRWMPAIDRNWAKFWTFYENESCPIYTDHSLFWGIFRWRTIK